MKSESAPGSEPPSDFNCRCISAFVRTWLEELPDLLNAAFGDTDPRTAEFRDQYGITINGVSITDWLESSPPPITP